MSERRSSSMGEYKLQVDLLEVCSCGVWQVWGCVVLTALLLYTLYTLQAELTGSAAENVELRAKINEMVDVMRDAAAAEDTDASASKAVFAGLLKENEGLRALLGLSAGEPLPGSP